jgi:uncharacterized protein YdhG (YjbR/CyaY superfamily)
MADTVDAYIATLPPATQDILQRLRQTLHGVLPGATETISYGIPALVVDGKRIVFFAGWARHVSLYPVPAGSAALERDMAPYVAARGTLKFPLKGPIPYPLIARIGKALRAPKRKRPASGSPRGSTNSLRQ